MKYIIRNEAIGTVNVDMYFDGLSYTVEIGDAKVYDSVIAAEADAKVVEKTYPMDRYYGWDWVKVEIKIKEN